MIVRSAALIAALTLLPAPAFAQESVEAAPPAADAPAEAPPAEAPPPAEAGPTAAAPALPEVAPAADTPAPAPAAASAPAPPVMQPAPPSPFSPDQRAAWLNQCRRTFQQAGAPLGGINGVPDACDTQLLDFERNYVPSADGAPPTIWVRVPIARAPAVAPAIDGDVE